ncbi:Peptidyl-prolyl cis-trans isomerase [Minicystis rosea]|nr:Peptidyl-prolyl cis-trans isomerase [Minicystis rosea]
MRIRSALSIVVILGAGVFAACSSAPSSTGNGDTTTGAGGTITGAGGASTSSTGSGDTTTSAGGASTTGTGGSGAGPSTTDGGPDAQPDAGPVPVDTLSSNRDRLLDTYFDFLKSSASSPQSNGISGSNVTSVCDLWAKLDPSARAVFLTLTARMQGSILGKDDTSMLWHVTRVYRISGGEDATMTNPGSCGGGEYNRMMMSMDATLHAAQVDASEHQGDVQSNGKHDIGDASASSFWRDSHDAGGAHDPFDGTDETEGGAPRGQTQYFVDPASTKANSPLGRLDLESLVDPYALEMDQDYDCIHLSNPLCTYVTYGPFCLPQSSALGTEVYTKSYGSFDPDWHPAGCN